MKNNKKLNLALVQQIFFYVGAKKTEENKVSIYLYLWQASRLCYYFKTGENSAVL